MDNILAEKEAAESVVVTMDNSHFGWDYDLIAKNFKENIIPLIEEIRRIYESGGQGSCVVYQWEH